jgi:alginate O-acetyltransferase complex protein AlgI
VVFSSVPFLFYFLPLFLGVYWVAPGMRAKNLILLVASLVFYAWGEPWFVLVLIGQIAFNYLAALSIDVRKGIARRRATAIGIGTNLLLLGVFKYADFLVSTVNAALPMELGPLALPGLALPGLALPSLALPLGISFFTFHSISYLIDVHRRQVTASSDPVELAVYIAMFPQLVAGPIIRYHTIAHLLAHRRMTSGRASAGMRIVVIGLAQKVLIADEVARVAEAVFDHVSTPSAVEAWLGLVAYTVQIYFDFLGYSNMAIGLGCVLGFAFPRNFRLPYTATSITDFWRRWHISLSQWLRDYLYIPLGGSRGSTIETYRNLWLVFLLCGLWHGANWTFVIWGAHHGCFLVAERAGLARVLRRCPALVVRAYTLLAVVSGWVWFRSHDVAHAATLFDSLVGLNGWSAVTFETHTALFPTTLAALLIGIALSLADWRSVRSSVTHPNRTAMALVDTARTSIFFALSVLSVAAGSYSPFLYFRF